MAAMVKRRPSAPVWTMMSSGSTVLPLDLLIFLPSASPTRELMHTWWNGTSPMNFRPSMAMRATQKKMMSQEVTSTLVG